MRVVIEMVTPVRATELLARNDGNRRLRMSIVRGFVGAMERGEWRVTHQSIAIDSEGNLLDGQHRLAAVVKHGAPVKMAVAYGADRETYFAIDRGAKRDMRDYFGDLGIMLPGITFLSRVMYGSKFTIPQMEALVAALIEPISRCNLELSGTKRKVFTCGAMRAAAMIRVYRDPVNAQYAIDTYNILANLQTENPNMPLVAHKFIRQSEEKHKRTREEVLFVKGLKIFNPECANFGKLMVRDASPELDVLRKEITAILLRGNAEAA